jgi:hypothetical protein
MIGHELSAKLMECTKANASILFALCLLPLVAIVGSTSDFKRLSAYEVKFERALDVTAVSTARIAMRDEVGYRALKHVAKRPMRECVARPMSFRNNVNSWSASFFIRLWS